MKKPVIILTKGLPASGKTTWARKKVQDDPSFIRINKDDLRAMFHDSVHSKAREAFILNARDGLIAVALSEFKSVIVDDTNLNPIHESRIRDSFGDLAEVVIQDFTDVPLEVCLERDKKRANYVGEKAIKRMWRQYLAPLPPKVTHDLTLPYAILCDLDGTLAILNGRDPYDASTCEQDEVVEPIRLILSRFETSALSVILVSGRKDTHRAQTERWLEKHRIEFAHLYMRRGDDNRRDAVVKREIYDEHIRGKYNVAFVLDDRDQVVELWRSLGLTCLQVADGDF